MKKDENNFLFVLQSKVNIKKSFYIYTRLTNVTYVSSFRDKFFSNLLFVSILQ